MLELLRDRRLIAIVRGRDEEAAFRTVVTLMEEGVDLVEVSLVTPGAVEVIRRAATEVGRPPGLGAGTALTADDAHRAAGAGARYLVTPAICDAVTSGNELGLPVVAGALTPSEVVTALGRGAVAVKLFPASLGGVRYLRALRDPFPDVAFVPVGGVDQRAASDHLAAGAAAVGVGSPLVGDAADGGSLAALRDRARSFLAAVGQA